MPSTATPAEQIFSASGLAANQQRASLKAGNVDALVFLNRNMPDLFEMKARGYDKAEQEPTVATASTGVEPELPYLTFQLAESWDDA